MGTINDLNTVDTLVDDDKFVIWQKQAGATRAITAENMAAYFGAELSDEYQPLDATLTALAALGLEDRKLIRGTGVDTAENVFSGDLFEIKNARDFGVTGDGVTIDTADWLLFQAAAETGVGYVPVGEYLIGQVGIPDGGSILGAGSNVTSLVRQANGNLFNAPTAQNVHVSGMTLDLKRSVNGWSGHGISSIASDSTFENLRVLDFGSDLIAGGGTGVLVVKPVSGDKPVRARLLNSTFVGDDTAARSYGWIFSDVDYSFASNIYAEKIVGYAHELKNDARFNALSSLIGVDSNWSLAYGQETVGVDGCDMNVATGVIAASCDGGYLIGEGFGNVLAGMVYRETDSPGREVTKNAVRYESGADQNLTIGVVSIGAGVTQTVRHGDSDRNYTQVAAHDGASVVARFDGTSEGNFVEVVHPGSTASVAARIVYGDVTTLRGATANIVHNPPGGERIGSLNGYFLDKLGTSGATYSSSHYWRYDSDQHAFHAFGVPGNSGDGAGLIVNISGVARQGQFSYAKGANDGSDYWLARVGATDVLRIANSTMRPSTDNSYDFGNTSFRYRATYSRELRPGGGSVIWTSGAGTPESSVTAPVGSLYTDTSGSTGTTLYVKETGTGNTGWVAK